MGMMIPSDPNLVFKVLVPISAEYHPLPDITAYELAVLLPYLFGNQMTQQIWDNLGPSVTRHLKRR
jgi:hypothetical protein